MRRKWCRESKINLARLFQGCSSNQLENWPPKGKSVISAQVALPGAYQTAKHQCAFRDVWPWRKHPSQPIAAVFLLATWGRAKITFANSGISRHWEGRCWVGVSPRYPQIPDGQKIKEVIVPTLSKTRCLQSLASVSSACISSSLLPYCHSVFYSFYPFLFSRYPEPSWSLSPSSNSFARNIHPHSCGNNDDNPQQNVTVWETDDGNRDSRTWPTPIKRDVKCDRNPCLKL